MNSRDKEKLDRATRLAADSICSVIDAYVRVLEILSDNELKKYKRLPSSLQFSPTGVDLQDSIYDLSNQINDAELILFSKVMELSGKENIFKPYIF